MLGGVLADKNSRYSKTKTMKLLSPGFTKIRFNFRKEPMSEN